MKRKIKVTVTKVKLRRETVFAGTPPTFCQVCQTETETLSAKDAAMFLETDIESIFVLIGTQKIHGFFTRSNNLRVCKNSLFK